MPSQNRELTGREKQRIKKLITSLCANYDKEYGCAAGLRLSHVRSLLHKQRSMPIFPQRSATDRRKTASCVSQ